MRFKRGVPNLGITPGSILYAKKVKPQPGDIVLCDVVGHTGRVRVGRFIRGDGFRVLMGVDGQPQLITCEAVLVVHSIVGGEP